MHQAGLKAHTCFGPCIIVHGAPDVARACALGLGLTLLSAPGAAGTLGALWWAALVRDARRARPALAIAERLDCGTAPGRVLQAVQCGLIHLVLAPCPAFASLAELVTLQGGSLLDAPPAALDLAKRGAERRLAAWLAGEAPDDTELRLG